jgi:hypothetical protein
LKSDQLSEALLPALQEGKPAGSNWQGDDWESARLRRFTLGLAATPEQRLAWLEEAITLAWASGALPRPRT